MTRRGWRTPESASYAKRPYDLVKEVTIGFGVVLVLTLALATAFSSPDRPALTVRSWAAAAPQDVVATAVGELAGTTTSAGYGPPYNTASDGQKLGFLAPAKWAGTTQTFDSANDLVINPLSRSHPDAALAQALRQWNRASADTRTSWSAAYGDALTASSSGSVTPTKAYGPVPVLASGFERAAASGQLDGLLAPASAVGNDTLRLLLLADGSYLESQAQVDHLTGSQWGMMNEAGNYPGQPWLWLYTFWYQVPSIASSPNADLIVTLLMGILSVALICVPFIPGLRSLPRFLKIHRLIWRS